MGSYVLVVLVLVVSEDCSLVWVCGVVALVFVVQVVSRDYQGPWWQYHALVLHNSLDSYKILLNQQLSLSFTTNTHSSTLTM